MSEPPAPPAPPESPPEPAAAPPPRADGNGYRVQLAIFEGPLDLLLYLIRKEEVEVTDIPIARICDQYLEYLGILSSLNLDIAGDFLVMAATLVHLKTVMLLPRVEVPGEEPEDPRADLVRQLQEYERLKPVMDHLRDLEQSQRERYERPDAVLSEYWDRVGVRLELDLFQLLELYREVSTPRPAGTAPIRPLVCTVEEKMEEILGRLGEEGGLVFQLLVRNYRLKEEIIAAFLALLELIRLRQVRVDLPAPDRIVIRPAA